MKTAQLVFAFHVIMAFSGIAMVYAIALLRNLRALHMLQLDSYANARLIRWFALKPLQRFFEPKIATVLLFLWLMTLTSFRIALIPASLSAMWLTASIVIFYFMRRKKTPEKKPLVFTGRAKRILALTLALNLAACYWMVCDWYLDRDFGLLFWRQFIFLQLCPLQVIVANVLLIPVQFGVNRQFLRQAHKKLTDWNPRVIAVAGSFGKTSTKYFIDGILTGKYRTLKTPGSFNTPMGICRVINEHLQAFHEVFIVEMGTYRKGDVREIASFVKPQIGIISSIGPEHMERFKTLQNVKAANYELIESLPDNGIAVINLDSPESRQLYEKADATKRWKVFGFSLEQAVGSSLWAENITYNKEGTTFTLVSAEEEKVPVRTQLLGKHAVGNIVGASCVAMQAGMTLKEIALNIPRLEPAPHRLQLLQNANNVVVIDDAYNSNPDGAREALNVLKSFSDGKRVLVTPGMVELGHLHETENEAFGFHAASCCDHVILVGPKQTLPIARGLAKASFAREKLIVVTNLQDATVELGKLLKPGDTVLFENDLPDQYDEK